MQDSSSPMEEIKKRLDIEELKRIENKVFDQQVERLREQIPEEARVLLSPFAGMLAAMLINKAASTIADESQRRALEGVAQRQFERSAVGGAVMLTKLTNEVDLSALEEEIQKLRV